MSLGDLGWRGRGRAFRGIVWRECLRFFRQRGRFFAALVRPLVWLFIFAAGFRAGHIQGWRDAEAARGQQASNIPAAPAAVQPTAPQPAAPAPTASHPGAPELGPLANTQAKPEVGPFAR